MTYKKIAGDSFYKPVLQMTYKKIAGDSFR